MKGTQHNAELMTSLTEGMWSSDRFTGQWLEQAVLRMRRELCWLWRHHQPADRIADSIERSATGKQRQEFFAQDETAHFLDGKIRGNKPRARSRNAKRATLGWLAEELTLSHAEIFVVALALAATRDAAVGNMIAVLQGDTRRTLPTLGLAQWLWDQPAALLPLLSPTHRLYSLGVLQRGEAIAGDEWSVPISMLSVVALAMEGHLEPLPPELQCIAAGGKDDADEAMPFDTELLARRMCGLPRALEVVPVSLPFLPEALDAERARVVLKKIASVTGRRILAIRENVQVTSAILEGAGSYCWLSGADLLLPSRALGSEAQWQMALLPFPIYAFAAAHEESSQGSAKLLPALRILPLSYTERVAVWEAELARRGMTVDKEVIAEVSYRFRLDAVSIEEVVGALSLTQQALTQQHVLEACYQQVGVHIGGQATLIEPRFVAEDLVLDAERSTQFQQLLAAARTVSQVHAEWGTGKAWGEAGISALFAGPSGTGKTMAAEVLAAELRLPLYRVDLSQVVNKYIGETEKNLRRLFDAAEQADLLLFFDEADALFGQRTQVRNSNDRFANLEVSYLLQRMESFRGMAILATNRKKDLDEAFLRRLRYVIEFPLPGEKERSSIWQRSIPPQVAVGDLDFALLAREFAIPGGNIRSIVLNACLQAAARSKQPELDMPTVLSAVEREFDKMGRPFTLAQKSQWQALNGGALR